MSRVKLGELTKSYYLCRNNLKNSIFNKTFITTTLPYVNSVPHIGHAFEFILGDAIAKWLKIQNPSTHFNVGLDEHGLKVWEKSQELGISPEEHIDSLTKKWKEFCEKFDIKYDSFYKTSDKSHYEKVQIIWNRFVDNGDIYKATYRGKYCKGCESDKQDSELVSGRCSDHPTTDLDIIEEENYFFRLSKYKDSLLEWITNDSKFLEPSNKLQELKNLIIGSRDISISRSKEKCPWGITVPNDDNQVIYVWFEALWNYPFAAGYLTDNFKWGNVIQLCGPDNLKFQALIFQSFLEAEGIKKSDKLLVHGTILDKDGRKISKTLGNVIDPIDQLEKYGVNAVRYYTLAGLNTYSNSSWNEEDLKSIWNSDIVNDWGNLVSRVLHLVDIKCGGEVKYLPSDEYFSQTSKIFNEAKINWSNFKVKEALQKTNELVKFANKYINDIKPWASENYELELSNLYHTLKDINILYKPVFVDKYDEVERAIKIGKKQILFNKI